MLPSFGGYGVDLPMEALRRSGRFTIIEPPREQPAGLLYQDLVAAADVVVSKPGYGIVSECVANGTALLYTSRGRFIEYDVFVAEMPRVLRCRYISQEDLLAGRWADAIEALLAQPRAARTSRRQRRAGRNGRDSEDDIMLSRRSFMWLTGASAGLAVTRGLGAARPRRRRAGRSPCRRASRR